MYCSSITGKDLGSLISNVGSGVAAAPAAGGGGGAAPAGGEAKEEAKEEAKKEESEEESDDDMGFGEYSVSLRRLDYFPSLVPRLSVLKRKE